MLLVNHATVYAVNLDEAQTRMIPEQYFKLVRNSGSRGKMVGIQGGCSTNLSPTETREVLALICKRGPCRNPVRSGVT